MQSNDIKTTSYEAWREEYNHGNYIKLEADLTLEQEIEIIDILVEDLQGTCQCLEEVMATLGLGNITISTDAWEQLDDQIFYCTSCGWWFSTLELNEIDGEYYCENCAREREDETTERSARYLQQDKQNLIMAMRGIVEKLYPLVRDDEESVKMLKDIESYGIKLHDKTHDLTKTILLDYYNLLDNLPKYGCVLLFNPTHLFIELVYDCYDATGEFVFYQKRRILTLEKLESWRNLPLEFELMCESFRLEALHNGILTLEENIDYINREIYYAEYAKEQNEKFRESLKKKSV